MTEHRKSVGTWGPRCAHCEQPWPCRAALTEQLAAQTARAEAAERENEALKANVRLVREDSKDEIRRLQDRVMVLSDAAIADRQERDALRERVHNYHIRDAQGWGLTPPYNRASCPACIAAAGAGQEGGAV